METEPNLPGQPNPTRFIPPTHRLRSSFHVWNKAKGRLCERTNAFSRWAPLTPDFVHSVPFYSFPPRLRASLRRPTSILAAKSLSRSVPDGELRRLLLLFPFLVFKILIHFSWDSDFSLSPSCLLLWFVNFVMVIDELSTLHKGF